MKEKILVTGGTGFTGYNLCRKLKEDGNDVIAFVREGSDTEKLEALDVECRRLDITDQKNVIDNFNGIGIVYHIAAAYRTEHSDLNEFWNVNVGATGNLLDAALKSGVKRFVHCSTVGVQGEIEDPPADEDYRFNPGDHYQESKLQGELLARSYIEKGLPVTVVRPVGIYGPGDKRFLKLFKAVSKGRFVMIGSGSSLYHMTYIDDLISGIILCGTIDNASGEVFTIAGRDYTTLRELVDMIADTLEKPKPKLRIPYKPVFYASVLCEKICRIINVNPPLFPRRVEFFSLDRAFSISKARSFLGYDPKVDLSEGLRKTAKWYENEGLI